MGKGVLRGRGDGDGGKVSADVVLAALRCGGGEDDGAEVGAAV